MAKNFIKPGDHLPFTASGAVATGGVVVLGTLIGVALGAVADGDSGECCVEDVWELPKATGAAIDAWTRPSYDISAGKFAVAGSEATGDVIGAVIAVETAASADATVKVKLLPGAGSLKA